MKSKLSRSLSVLHAAVVSLGVWAISPMASAQLDALEERPYQPSESVVKGVTAALTDPSEEVVALAVRALGDWRQAGAAAEVTKLLDPNAPAAVRMEAFGYFKRLAAQARPHIAGLLKYAGDPDPNIRATILGVIFEANASADHAAAIRPLLDDSRSDVRVAAANCLGQAGKAAEPHRKALLDVISGSGSAEVKAAAIKALVKIGGMTAADLDTFQPLLGERDGEVRIAAWAATLNTIAATKAAGTIPAEKLQAINTSLSAQFNNEPPEIKAAIIEDAGKDKTTAEAYASGLVKQIGSGTVETKVVSLRVLGKVGEPALQHLALIAEKGKDPDSTVRAAAIAALGSIGAAAVKPNLALIAGALRDPSDLVRSEALLALPAAGDELRNFPYKMRDVFPDADAAVRSTLVKVLPIIVKVKGMDEESAANGRAALADKDPDVRIAIAFVIGQLAGGDATDLLPGLLTLVKDPVPAVRGAAVISLRGHAKDAQAKQQFRTAIRPLLKDRDAEVRWAVLDTFYELDPAQEPAIVAEIAALIKDEDQTVRSAAVRALGAAGAAAKPYLADIIRFFNDDPAVPPYAAAQAVSQISPLTTLELVSLLRPLYVYSDLLPLTRLTAHGASGGAKDGQLLIRLLGRSRATAREIVPAGETARAIELLQEALKAPLLHDKLKAEIESRLTELKAAR